MPLQISYPNGFRFLDTEHNEILALLADIKHAARNGNGADAQDLAKELLRKLRQHNHSEEAVMAQTGCPDRELHADYHDHLVCSLEHIIQLFDRAQMQAHRQEIAAHIEGKVREEIFFDRLLIDFLEHREASATGT